jgi:REP element-mobilizing transposase RayT
MKTTKKELGLIAQYLNLDPNKTSAATIINAIKDIEANTTELVIALDQIHDILNGMYANDIASIVNKALKANTQTCLKKIKAIKKKRD